MGEGARRISGHQNGNCRGWHNCLYWSAPDLTLTFQTASQRPQGEGRWLSIRGDLPISSAPVLQKEGTLYGELRSDVHFRFSNRLSIASNWFLLAQCALRVFAGFGAWLRKQCRRGGWVRMTASIVVRHHILPRYDGQGQHPNSALFTGTNQLCNRKDARLLSPASGCA